jgi:8-oxo-dGTP diphosphatase
MSLPGQRPDPNRYNVIPRTLSFLIHEDKVLLIKVGPGRSSWSGKYNGIGGHIEQSEDPKSSAIREISEEAGISIDQLTLCGVMMIDVGHSPGIGLYIFVGETDGGVPLGSNEGVPEWIHINSLGDVPLVEDLIELLPRSIHSYRNHTPFSGVTTFSPEGDPILSFN